MRHLKEDIMAADESISFPHLGIVFKNLKNSVSLFGIEIAYYGIVIGLGMVVAIILALRDARRNGQKEDDYIDAALFAIIFAIIGARLYYVIFQWDYYKAHLADIFNIRQGGLAIYGGVIAGALVCVIFAKKRKLPMWMMLDTGAIGLVTGQMIGRWGNFFNREAYGGNTDSLFAMRINILDPNVSVTVEEGVKVIDGTYIQVHPTFLYESFCCLCILIVLQLYKRHKKFDGEVFMLYLALYGTARFFIEGLRTDQLLIPNTKIPVSQLLSSVLAITGFSVIVYRRFHLRKKREDQSLVEQAKLFAERVHDGQTWELEDGNKISYYEGHLLPVYREVMQYNIDGAEQILGATALLHDTLEDTDTTYEELKSQFGAEIADNVLCLTREENGSYDRYIDHVIQNGSDDAVLVKLADRYVNTVGMAYLEDSDWRNKKIKEAKYMLKNFKTREVQENYRRAKELLLEKIGREVKKINENKG